MELAKLKIKPRSSELDEIEVLFNPNSYTITKSVTWSPPPKTGGGESEAATDRKVNAPTLSFGGGGSRQLSLELFFDVTENPGIDDVRRETNRIAALTRIVRDKKRPPECEISWGNAPPTGSDFPFIGVVSNLTQRFTYFTSDGRPVRANLTVTFVEFLDPETDHRENDPELTTRVVKRGETLSAIAAEVYRDPKRWRVIAEANRLDDPRRLEIGRRLTIPKLGRG